MKGAQAAAQGPQAPAQGPIVFLRRFIEIWALAGGLALVGIALMSTWSATAGLLFGKPLPGDVELVEVFVAVAVFMFLPYCQQTGSNVTADLFTAKAGRRTLAALNLLSAVVALGFSGLLLWRMAAGLLDYLKYVETTTILHIPIWYAYVPALASLLLLALASLISVRDALAEWRAGVRTA